MREHLVSILVPNYNHASFLEARINSILNQTFRNFEVIILDDCSTDHSQSIINNLDIHPNIVHKIYNTENTGNTFQQWKKGISLAKGKYIWIAESDDYNDLTFLEKLISKISSDEAISLVYSQSYRVDKDDKITGTWLNHTMDLDADLFLSDFVMEGNLFIEDFLIYRNVIPNASAVLFRKDKLDNIGEIDTDIRLKNCGDWLLYLKVITNSKIGFVSEPLNFFRYHSDSVIANARKQFSLITLIQNDFLMRKKLFSYFNETSQPSNLQRIKKNNRKVVRRYKYKKGIFYFKTGQKLKGFRILCSVGDRVLQEAYPIKNIYRKWKRVNQKLNGRA